jgi:hypothetical protein
MGMTMTEEKRLNVYDIIKQLREECLKEYRVYDDTFRPLAIYQAHTDCEHGEPCMKTSYIYAGSSGRIVKKKEEIVPWDSSWDV